MTTKGKIIMHSILIPSLLFGAWYGFVRTPKVKLEPIDYKRVAPAKYYSMVRISTDKGICTATVISRNYALTAGHCVVGQIGSKYKIMGVEKNGADKAKKAATAVAARGVMYGGLDLGLLKGDFKDFEYAPIKGEDREVSYAPIFVSCGFGGGSLSAMCRPMLGPQPYGFIAVGMGNLLPGMSGGPVINIFTGDFVGVNNAQYENAAFFTPVRKALSFLGLDTIGEDD